MDRPVSNLLQVAAKIGETDPVLAYNLEQSVLHVIRTSSRTSGVWDKVKGIFKGKSEEKEPEKEPEEKKAEPPKAKPQPPAPKKKSLGEGWQMTVDNYVKLLSETKDDAKTIKYLKEMFSKVKPVLEEERAVLAARIASRLSGNRTAGQGGRPDFLLELTPAQKFTSHPSDKIFITYYNGWSWTHTNVDGSGDHDTTATNVTPARMVEMIDEYIVPDAAAEEARNYFSDLVESGEMEGGVEVPSGPSALPPAEQILTEMSPAPPPVHPFISDYNPVYSTTRLCSLLINVAHANPEMRSRIIPIVSKYVSKKP